MFSSILLLRLYFIPSSSSSTSLSASRINIMKAPRGERTSLSTFFFQTIWLQCRRPTLSTLYFDVFSSISRSFFSLVRSFVIFSARFTTLRLLDRALSAPLHAQRLTHIIYIDLLAVLSSEDLSRGVMALDLR